MLRVRLSHPQPFVPFLDQALACLVADVSPSDPASMWTNFA
jgi:hypothetical protein